MPPTELDHPLGLPTRSREDEMRAARVVAASEAAIAALQVTTEDRRRVRDGEWSETDDSLADLDEAADRLQGFAAWAIGTTPHPRLHDVRQQLVTLSGELGLDLKGRLRRHVSEGGPLMLYVDALLSLRAALADYFADQTVAPVKPV